MFDLRAHPGLIETEYGLPHLVFDRAAELVEVAEGVTWDGIVVSWLTLLVEALPPEYQLKQTHSTAVIGPTDRVDLDAEHASVRRRMEQIRSLLLDSETSTELDDDECIPDILLLFGSQSLYYDYVAPYLPDGDSIASGGMHIRSRIPHIVINGTGGWSRSVTALHEMTHQALYGRDLPLWVEEAVCRYIPGFLLHADTFMLTRETVARHKRVWAEHGLQQFWSGESFGIPDDRSELSYHLAEVLLRLILSKQPKSLKPFLRRANWTDAGDSAAIETFGFGVGDLAADFLGEGPWAPDPGSWPDASD